MASAIPVIPELPELTGPGLGAQTAIRSLADANEEDSGLTDPSGESDETGANAHSFSGEKSDAGGIGEPEPVKRGRGRPPKSAVSAESRANARRRKAARMKRGEVIALYLDAAERLDDVSAQLEGMRAEVATVRTVGADVVDQSVNEMVGDAIELYDTGVQFLAGLKGERFAEAVALQPEQKARLAELGARVAKIHGAAYLQHSPELALGFCALSVIGGQVLGYVAAKRADG